MAILGGSWGLWGILALVAAIWVIYEAATNKSLSTGQKALWIILALFFSIITAIVYYLVMKKK
ncbi:MAG: PLDc N-terminal domain-containing protein [Candidatus Woesearchaeota archaeon]|nr:PLDc N-terminal domain-containing protein [Candidatus Woesearchaeota archaeon]